MLKELLVTRPKLEEILVAKTELTLVNPDKIDDCDVTPLETKLTGNCIV